MASKNYEITKTTISALAGIGAGHMMNVVYKFIEDDIVRPSGLMRLVTVAGRIGIDVLVGGVTYDVVGATIDTCYAVACKVKDLCDGMSIQVIKNEENPESSETENKQPEYDVEV